MKMPMKSVIKSKGMLGGLFLCGVGLYLLSVDNQDLGMIAIGNGFGILGIRDAQP